VASSIKSARPNGKDPVTQPHAWRQGFALASGRWVAIGPLEDEAAYKPGDRYESGFPLTPVVNFVEGKMHLRVRP
jgi:hypothetical protein